ncbi:Thioredoxin reductase [Madurella mycetomatis]|uniref:Thioredoxin reductase n=1 Tax=Madurella mycetomatis TaxID=100816 RepID=A0A175WCJ0_9PEZI|nr:Thioredoxin reductase [Madurella mycetomatis]
MAAAADELVHDVLIVGGGHAGLSAALTLYRAQLKTIVFDTGRPRNRWNTPVRLTPTWESTTPQEQIEISRKELAKTDFVRFVDAAIVTVSKLEAGDDDGKRNSGCFRAVDETGQPWLGRKLLLAVGSSNVFPSMDGYESNFAKHMYVTWMSAVALLSMIFGHFIYFKYSYPCMFQFGFEQRGVSSAGVLAIQGLAVAQMALALADDGHKFTDRFTIYTDGNPPLASELESQVSGRGMRVDDRKIKQLRASKMGMSDRSDIHGDDGAETEGILLDFADGTSQLEGFLVHRPLTRCESPLVSQLGLAITPAPVCGRDHRKREREREGKI